MFVCKKLDQYRNQFPSSSTPGEYHTVVWDRARAELFCSCKGFHNWEQRNGCKHVVDAAAELECDWHGDNPNAGTGGPECPKCGGQVYDLSTFSFAQIAPQTQADMPDDIVKLQIGNSVGVKRGDDLFIFDASETQKIDLFIKEGKAPDGLAESQMSDTRSKELARLVVALSD